MTTDQMALYLANCIAATAHDFAKKSAPKGERIRHRQLCETVSDLLRGRSSGWLTIGRRTLNAETVAERLDEMVKMLRCFEDSDRAG